MLARRTARRIVSPIVIPLETLRAAPKVLLHDHLDGGLRPRTIVELARDQGYRGLPTTDTAELARWFHASAASGSLSLYLPGFTHTTAVMQTDDALDLAGAPVLRCPPHRTRRPPGRGHGCCRREGGQAWSARDVRARQADPARALPVIERGYRGCTDARGTSHPPLHRTAVPRHGEHRQPSHVGCHALRRISASIASRRTDARGRRAPLDQRHEERARRIRRARRDHLRAHQTWLRTSSRRARARWISIAADRLTTSFTAR